MPIPSLVWAIGFSLFLGGLGLPIPENPLLIGGGYAVQSGAAPALTAVVVWYGAICLGDGLLYGLAYLFFKHPRPAAVIKRWVGVERLDAYQRAFAVHGALTLFLARFAWGVRFLAYLAAGAAQYPWKRFLIVDCVSVLVQVALFMGLGYVAGDKLQSTPHTARQIALVIGIAALICIALTWISTLMMKRIPSPRSVPLPRHPAAAPVEIRVDDCEGNRNQPGGEQQHQANPQKQVNKDRSMSNTT